MLSYVSRKKKGCVQEENIFSAHMTGIGALVGLDWRKAARMNNLCFFRPL